MQNLFILSVFVIFLLNVSCTKEVEPGPAGPQGPVGAQGPQGPQGPAGAPGNSGIIYSDWFQIDNPGMTQNNLYYYQEFDVPAIDRDFINKGGSVLVYYGITDDGDLNQIRNIKPLPDWGKEGYKNVPDEDAVYYEIDYFYSEGKLTIGITITDGEEKITSNQYFFHNVWTGQYEYFRYVLIPGGMKVNRRDISYLQGNSVR